MEYNFIGINTNLVQFLLDLSRMHFYFLWVPLKLAVSVSRNILYKIILYYYQFIYFLK